MARAADWSRRRSGSASRGWLQVANGDSHHLPADHLGRRTLTRKIVAVPNFPSCHAWNSGGGAPVASLRHDHSSNREMPPCAPRPHVKSHPYRAAGRSRRFGVGSAARSVPRRAPFDTRRGSRAGRGGSGGLQPPEAHVGSRSHRQRRGARRHRRTRQAALVLTAMRGSDPLSGALPAQVPGPWSSPTRSINSSACPVSFAMSPSGSTSVFGLPQLSTRPGVPALSLIGYS